MPNQFLFLEEVAAETRATLSTVRHWIAVGKLPSVRPGRRRLVRRADLERFLEASGLASPAAPVMNSGAVPANEARTSTTPASDIGARSPRDS
jgi:excisionase family DNA binding protein